MAPPAFGHWPDPALPSGCKSVCGAHTLWVPRGPRPGWPAQGTFPHAWLHASVSLTTEVVVFPEGAFGGLGATLCFLWAPAVLRGHLGDLACVVFGGDGVEAPRVTGWGHPQIPAFGSLRACGRGRCVGAWSHCSPGSPGRSVGVLPLQKPPGDPSSRLNRPLLLEAPPADPRLHVIHPGGETHE